MRGERVGAGEGRGSVNDHSTISEQGTCSATAVLQQSVPVHSWSTAGCVSVSVCLCALERERYVYVCLCACRPHTVADSQISAIH